MEKAITNKIKSLVDIYQYTPQAKPAHKEEWRKSIKELKRSRIIAIIIDAKWKLYERFGATVSQGGINRNDLYQIHYYYARADDEVIGLFVAPTKQRGSPPDIHQLTNHRHSIGLLNLDISKEKEDNIR